VRALPTRLDGPILIEPAVHGDPRGFFSETYRANLHAELGVVDDFVQDNHSRSARGVLRGMHFSIGEGQAKLVRCARGAMLDVAVDLRRDSPTFGQWEAHALDDADMRQLYLPVGFAHGFCVTSEVADVVYKCSTYYAAETETGVRLRRSRRGDRVARARAVGLRARQERATAGRDRRRAPVPLPPLSLRPPPREATHDVAHERALVPVEDDRRVCRPVEGGGGHEHGEELGGESSSRSIRAATSRQASGSPSP